MDKTDFFKIFLTKDRILGLLIAGFGNIICSIHNRRQTFQLVMAGSDMEAFVLSAKTIRNEPSGQQILI